MRLLTRGVAPQAQATVYRGCEIVVVLRTRGDTYLHRRPTMGVFGVASVALRFVFWVVGPSGVFPSSLRRTLEIVSAISFLCLTGLFFVASILHDEQPDIMACASIGVDVCSDARVARFLSSLFVASVATSLLLYSREEWDEQGRASDIICLVGALIDTAGSVGLFFM